MILCIHRGQRQAQPEQQESSTGHDEYFMVQHQSFMSAPEWRAQHSCCLIPHTEMSGHPSLGGLRRRGAAAVFHRAATPGHRHSGDTVTQAQCAWEDKDCSASGSISRLIILRFPQGSRALLAMELKRSSS